VKWQRKSKYHEESDPPRFYLAASKVPEGWRFTLTDRTELVGCFDTADKAKAEAERHDQDRNAAAA
jgi:hypothetical protein